LPPHSGSFGEGPAASSFAGNLYGFFRRFTIIDFEALDRNYFAFYGVPDSEFICEDILCGDRRAQIFPDSTFRAANFLGDLGSGQPTIRNRLHAFSFVFYYECFPWVHNVIPLQK